MACSVELGAGQGERTDLSTRVERSGKVSAVEFARVAGVADRTVARYLDRWALAIENGAPVPPATELTPGMVG